MKSNDLKRIWPPESDEAPRLAC